MREYYFLLDGLPYELVTLAERGILVRVEEVGTTLEENATLKATGYAALSHLITLADDSGLEVDALGGQPGPLSARYAGEGASDKERIDYLLAKLIGVPWEKRTACFRCAIAIAIHGGKVELCYGQCRGLIAFEPKGHHGFGYDPIFYLPDLGKTMAELPMEEKNQRSHRGKAAEKARPILERLCRAKGDNS